MQTLLLIRHAKSSWDLMASDDLMRPLNTRGYNSIELIAQRELILQNLPDHILCSPAVRAYSTAVGLVRQLNLGVNKLKLCDWIYDAYPQQLLDGLRENSRLEGTVWLVGHNPGIEELACDLTGKTVQMPTLAVAAISDPLTSNSRLQGWTAPKA